jgi:outer membrane protein assembly factor BamD (BamD/ComL family)
MISFREQRQRVMRLTRIVALAAGAVGVSAQSAEESARRRLESGRAFLKSQNYGEALKDFEVIRQAYGSSSVADDALLETATYQLEIAHDAKGAEASVDTLLKQYASSDSAPMAHVLRGRIALAYGFDPAAVDAALAGFDRVPREFEGTEAVPAALYFAAEAARRGGRRDESIERFGKVLAQYPGSVWTQRTLLGSAAALAAAGQPFRAMEQLQRLRQQFPASGEAATALEWTTILYRLYVRAPLQSPYLFSNGLGGPGGKFREVGDIAVDRDNNLLVASRTGVMVLNSKGGVVRNIAVPEPQGLFFDSDGHSLTLHEGGGLREEGKPGLVLSTATADGRVRPLRLDAGVATSGGDLLVSDRSLKTIVRFSADGKPKGEFARQVAARRLAITDLDDVAALDIDTRTVTLLDRAGAITSRIAERGAGYQLREPVDVAFDGLGHVYVLDRTAVYVFSQQGPKLLATFTVQERMPGAFGEPQALALDTAGRLFVFDRRTDMVQVYR